MSWYSAQPLGVLRVLEPPVRADGLELLGADHLQHRAAAVPVVALCAHEIALMFIMSIIVNTGMWLERFVIVVTSLYRDYPAVLLGHLQGDPLGLRHTSSARWDCSRSCSSCSFASCP